MIRLSVYKGTFRASCYSARLSWALVLTWVSPFDLDIKFGFGFGEEYVIVHIHCYSTCLSWTLVLTWVSPFGLDIKVGFGLEDE